jgi:hypothetical protein
MTDEPTQATVDSLKTNVLLITPSGKFAEVEAVLKSKAHLPLGMQAQFIVRLIATFENADLAQFLPEPPKGSQNNNGFRRPEKSNPWSKEGWNVSAQGKLVKAIGEAKADGIAQAAGCKIGSTKPNPSYF